MKLEMLAGGGSSWRRVIALALRELEELGQGFRWRATFLLIVVLMTVLAWVDAVRYRTAADEPREALEHYGAELERATVGDLADILHPAVKPSWRLAFLAEGQQKRLPNVYRQALSPWWEPELESRHRTNERLHDAEPLDWLFVIRTVLSLAAFLLGYDAVCGPRQRKVLELVLAYAVERWQVMVAKLAAIWAALAVPFVLGALLSLAVLRLYGGLGLTSSELVKVFLVGLLGLAATALFAAIALVVSASSRAANRSLVSLTLIWVTAVVVIPAAGALVTQMIRPLPSEQEISRRSEEIRRQVEFAPGALNDWRPPEWARDDDYALERRSAQTQNRRFELQEALRHDLMEQQFAQVALARRLASLSPMLLVQDAAERLAGSGPYRDHHFIEQVWAFRGDLASHVRRLDGDDPESPHLLFFSRYLSARPVDAGDVPRFRFAELTVSEGLRLAAAPLLAFALLSLLVTAAAFYRFARYQVR